MDYPKIEVMEIYNGTLRQESIKLQEPLAARFLALCIEVQALNPTLPLANQIVVATTYLYIIIDNIDARYHD